MSLTMKHSVFSLQHHAQPAGQQLHQATAGLTASMIALQWLGREFGVCRGAGACAFACRLRNLLVCTGLCSLSCCWGTLSSTVYLTMH